MTTLTAESFNFLTELWENNNKQWFDSNRKRYEENIREPFKKIAESLAGPVSLLLPEFSGKPKISRINNDIRFSPNKEPYKEHVWMSFGSGHGCSSADIFAGINRNGWSTGCGIGSNKRESLDEWRRNLIDNVNLWRKYASAIGLGTKVMKHLEESYKKPLFPDIPEDIHEIVQAKGIWIVDDPRPIISSEPEREFYEGICKFLPLYHFMNSTQQELKGKLSSLGKNVKPPTEEVERIWGMLG